MFFKISTDKICMKRDTLSALWLDYDKLQNFKDLIGLIETLMKKILEHESSLPLPHFCKTNIFGSQTLIFWRSNLIL